MSPSFSSVRVLPPACQPGPRLTCAPDPQSPSLFPLAPPPSRPPLARGALRSRPPGRPRSSRPRGRGSGQRTPSRAVRLPAVWRVRAVSKEPGPSLPVAVLSPTARRVRADRLPGLHRRPDDSATSPSAGHTATAGSCTAYPKGRPTMIYSRSARRLRAPAAPTAAGRARSTRRRSPRGRRAARSSSRSGRTTGSLSCVRPPPLHVPPSGSLRADLGRSPLAPPPPSLTLRTPNPRSQHAPALLDARRPTSCSRS